MKGNLDIQKDIRSDSDIISLVEFHKQIYAGTNLHNCLIYYDSNFYFFLKQTISTEDNAIFILRMNEKTVGFIHFKIHQDELFWNNVFLDKSVRGKGVGKYFLKEALEAVDFQKFQSFSLDVLASKVKALSWYRKMGMAEAKRFHWYQLANKRFDKKAGESGNQLVRMKDKNGFDSLFGGDSKIGTVINSENLILHNDGFWEMINPEDYKKILTIKDSHVEENSQRHLESTLRMTVSIKELENHI